MKVVLLHDEIPPAARPDELDTLVQVEVIEAALARLGHASQVLPCTLDLTATADALRAARPDVVFNLVESLGGCGRLLHLVPALLDHLAIPYTGAHTEALFLTTSKVLTKRTLRAAGLATPPWFTPAGPSRPDLPLPGRYIIKPVWEDASIGLDDDAVREFRDLDELARAARARAGRFGGPMFAELFIDGREFNLSLLADLEGPQVLAPAEIQFIDYAPDRLKLVNYRAKWVPDAFEYTHTPPTFDFGPQDAGLLETLRTLALQCWHIFDLRGYVRVDFRVDAAGRPWILEINANPCLSLDAGFAAAAERTGIEYVEVIRRIVADALSAGVVAQSD